MSYLSDSIANLAATQQGLLLLHLPAMLEPEFASGVVRRANQLRQASPAFAILISGEDDLSDPLVPRVSARNAIRYRRDSRLLVTEDGMNIQSINNAFRPILGPGFPAQETDAVSRQKLSFELMRAVLLDADLPADSAVVDECAAMLLACLDALEFCYSEQTESLQPWNALWVRHVDSGLAHLRTVLRRMNEQQVSTSIVTGVQENLWMCMGLPSPDGTSDWQRDPVARAKEVLRALQDYWSDESSAREAATTLDHSVGTLNRWSSLDWSAYHSMQVRRDSSLGALQDIATASADSMAAWRGLTLPLFVSPLPPDGSRLLITNAAGEDLAADAPGAPALLRLGSDEQPNATQVVRVIVPTLGRVDDAVLEKVRFAVSGRYSFQTEEVLRQGDRALVVVGRFRTTGSIPWTPQKVSVKVDPASQTASAGVIRSATAEVMMTASPVGVLSWPRRRNKLGKVEYAGPTSSEDPETDFTLELSDEHHLVLAWSSGLGPAAGPFQRAAHGQYDVAILAGGSSHLVQLDDYQFTLQSTSPKGAVSTPLNAAIFNAPFDVSPIGQPLNSSLRGKLESIYLEADPAQLLDSHGHLALPEGASSALLVEFDESLHIGGISGQLQTLSAMHSKRVDPEFAASPEAVRFKSAADVVVRTMREAGRWPSRISWANCLRDEELNEYLDAYTQLVEAATHLDSVDLPMTRMWAAYPFSVSVWRGGTCSAVMLSPLHPIRLAWIRAAEGTFIDAWDESDNETPDVSALAGAVEGWKFPLSGPSASPQGVMIAIPTEAGQEQLFVGWSMLVAVSTDDNRSLRSPERVAGQPAPGSSPSGLTAAAADAALKDFTRVNPHVTNVTIDLAAGVPSPRLEEIDEAVLASAGASAKSGHDRWGIRVLDSLNRTGDLPRSALEALLNQSAGSGSVTWSRYNPSVSQPRSNIRLVQDSGAALRMIAGRGSGGVVGAIPLRRFSSGSTKHSYEVHLNTFVDSCSWQSFGSALAAIESCPKPFHFGVRLSQEYLLGRDADWTVSGEAFLTPSALSQLVSAAGVGASVERVLWEWRPPHLQGRQGGAIDKRSYLTIARVSEGLRNNLRRKLKVIGGDEIATEQTVGRILDRLGTRGLGLSSLLSRGGTHESGAFGFYLTYELLDLAQTAESMDLVLPLDSCDGFLRALGADKVGDPSKRADLLLIRIQHGVATLVPIEIKFYGAEAAVSHSLPTPGRGLKEPLSQVLVTGNSLERLVESRRSLGSAHGALWDSAFTALCESGLSLTGKSYPADEIQTALGLLVDGRMPVRVGRPIIAFFQHGDADQPHATYLGERSGSKHYGAFVARPKEVFLGIANRDDRLRDSFKSLVTWACSEGIPKSTSQAMTHPGQEALTEATIQPQQGADLTKDAAAPAAAVPVPPRAVAAASPETPYHPIEVSKATRVSLGVGTERTELRPPGIEVDVGAYLDSIGKGRPTYWPSNIHLNQMNIGVAGDLGTGKTQLLQALIWKMRVSARDRQENPLSFLVLDYKKDFQKEGFLQSVGGRVLHPHRIPFNPFLMPADASPVQRYSRAKDFCDVLEKIYPGIGPKQRQRVSEVILASYAEGRIPTMRSVLQDYQEGGVTDSVTSILSSFVWREVFEEDQSKCVSFDDLLHDTVLVLAVDELGNDQNGKNALIALFLNEYFAYMQRCRKWPYSDGEPSLRRLNSFLLVDEAVNIMKYDFEVLMNLLLQGREFGVGVILASQYLSHFRAGKVNWAEPLLTWFIHKVPQATERELRSIGIDVQPEVAERVGALQVHEALYKSLGVSGRLIRGEPFYQVVPTVDAGPGSSGT